MSTKTGAVPSTRRRLQLVGARDDQHDPSDPPSELSTALPRLAAALDEAAEQQGWGAAPTLVRLTAWPAQPLTDGFELGVRPLDDEMGVVEALAGFTAPADWLAIGVVTEGNARRLDGDGHRANAAERADKANERRRVRCVHLVDRTGACASTVRLQGEAASLSPGADGEGPSGRIDDVCRRALGLRTAPPNTTSIELWAIVWLERLLVHQGRAPVSTRVSWREVAALHPAIAVLVGDDEQWAAKAAQHLERLGTLLADVHSWSVLRMACAAGEWPVDDVPPDLAEWLDDGAFSRWVLGGYPPLGQLAAAAAEVVPPSIGRRMSDTLRAWQLPVAQP